GGGRALGGHGPHPSDSGRRFPGFVARALCAEELHAEVGVVDEDAVDAGIPDDRPFGLPVAECRWTAASAELTDQEPVLGPARPREDAQPALVRVGDDTRGTARSPELVGRENR